MPLETLEVAEIPFQLILLKIYLRQVKDLRRLEPRLHEMVRLSLKHELESGQMDEIPGTGGWAKGRVASPSRNMGKSGGFRLVYLAFKVQRHVYLHTIYEHRAKLDLSAEEKRELKAASLAIKRAYQAGEWHA